MTRVSLLLGLLLFVLFAVGPSEERRATANTIEVKTATAFINALIPANAGKTIKFAANVTINVQQKLGVGGALEFPENSIIDGAGYNVKITDGVVAAKGGTTIKGLHFKHCQKRSSDGQAKGDCLGVYGTGVTITECTFEDGYDELLYVDFNCSATVTYCRFLNHYVRTENGKITDADKTISIADSLTKFPVNTQLEVSYSLMQNVVHLSLKQNNTGRTHFHHNLFRKMREDAAKFGSNGQNYFQYNIYDKLPANQFLWSDALKGACVYSRGECNGTAQCQPLKTELSLTPKGTQGFVGSSCYIKATAAAWPEVTPQQLPYNQLADIITSRAGSPFTRGKLSSRRRRR